MLILRLQFLDATIHCASPSPFDEALNCVAYMKYPTSSVVASYASCVTFRVLPSEEPKGNVPPRSAHRLYSSDM